MHNIKTLFMVVLIAICTVKTQTADSKQYTIGIFCLAIDKMMEDIVTRMLKTESPDSPRYTDLVKSLCRIPSTYMKFLNIHGVKFIPIFYNNNDVNVYLDQMDHLDGVLFIGGTVYTKYEYVTGLNKKTEYSVVKIDTAPYNEYYDVVRKIVRRAEMINDGGRKFLILGICVGFEGLLMSEAQFTPKMSYINNLNQQRTIYFDIPNMSNSESRIKRFLGPENTRLFAENASAYFFHNYGVSLDDFNSIPEISRNFMPVATFRVDSAKTPLDFIAAYEHRKYPFFGLQFHPEKILFETHPSMSNIVRNDITTKLSTLFSNFVYSELVNGAAGVPLSAESIKKYSCNRYLFTDFTIFHEAYVYDCLNFLSRNWATPPVAAAK